MLRKAIGSGVDYRDNSDFQGPHITNQIVRGALHSYPDQLTIVTKIGVRRDEQGASLPASSKEELIAAVHDNLRNFGLDTLHVVNFHLMISVAAPAEGSIEAPSSNMAGLQQ